MSQNEIMSLKIYDSYSIPYAKRKLFIYSWEILALTGERQLIGPIEELNRIL